MDVCDRPPPLWPGLRGRRTVRHGRDGPARRPGRVLLGPDTPRPSARSCRTPAISPTASAQAGDGIAKKLHVADHRVAPRFGVAYDVTGTQRVVVRGGVGLFYDRPDGNTDLDQIGNPPISRPPPCGMPSCRPSAAGLTTRAPAQLAIFQYDAKIPSTWQWQAGVQIALPWATALDVSYVASHGFNLVNPFNQPVDNLNAAGLRRGVPAGQPGPDAVEPQHRAGRRADHRPAAPVPRLRPDQQQWPRFWNDFSTRCRAFVNRRFYNGLQLGFNYTVTLRQKGTNDLNAAAACAWCTMPTAASGGAELGGAEALLSDNGMRRPISQGQLRVGSARCARHVDPGPRGRAALPTTGSCRASGPADRAPATTQLQLPRQRRRT